jgi:hypothetical protein
MAVEAQYDVPRGQVPCSYHPKTMTGLRCSRCGKPICPQCGVRTPVGLRCPECAGVRGLPTYQTSSNVLLKAGAAGLAVAVVVGVIWGFIPDWGFYLSLALGFGVAEAMARMANYKRGRDLQVVAMAMVALGLVISRYVLAQRLGITAEQINQLDQIVFSPAILDDFGGPVQVTTAMRLRIVDLIFAAIPFVITWIRFK